MNPLKEFAKKFTKLGVMLVGKDKFDFIDDVIPIIGSISLLFLPLLFFTMVWYNTNGIISGLLILDAIIFMFCVFLYVPNKSK